jgi:hypothetical protein
MDQCALLIRTARSAEDQSLGIIGGFLFIRRVVNVGCGSESALPNPLPGSNGQKDP